MPRKKYPPRSKLLKDKYGITITQWNKMYKLQDGKCPICCTKLFRYHEKQGRRAAPVDHCHKTGLVRGLVCYTCNRWRVGRNTVETARNVVKYLESEFDGREV